MNWMLEMNNDILVIELNDSNDCSLPKAGFDSINLRNSMRAILKNEKSKILEWNARVEFLYFCCRYLIVEFMKTLLVDIESANNLKAFLNAVEKLGFVKSVKLVSTLENENVPFSVNEDKGAYNWINPSRPASEKEIDELIDAMENSVEEHSTDNVRQSMKKWAGQKSR